jgi:hypothetical protein
MGPGKSASIKPEHPLLSKQKPFHCLVMRSFPCRLPLRLWRKTSREDLYEYKNRMTSQDPFSACAAGVRELIRRSSSPRARAQALHSEGAAASFNSLALDLFGQQFAANLPYQRFCAARAATPTHVRHWTGIPAMPTSAFKELAVTSLSPADRIQWFSSSGTTGQQSSRHFHHAASLALYEASLLPWLQAHLLPELQCEGRAGSRQSFVILTPPPALAPHSSLVHMFETVRRQFGNDETAYAGTVDAEGAWRLDPAATMKLLARHSEARQPVVLLGTAFSFVHLLDQMARTNHHVALPVGSRILETGGYKGRSRIVPKVELHRQLSRTLGIPETHILSEYGMCELSSQAYDGVVSGPVSAEPPESSSRFFRFPPWVRVRVVSPETGKEVGDEETGLIQVYDLANVWSVMAIQTEDLATRRGLGFELLGRAALAEPRGCSLISH